MYKQTHEKGYLLAPSSEAANRVLTICTKDLISSEAKYHGSCYRNFVRVTYEMATEGTLTISESSKDDLNLIFEPVINFCEKLEFPTIDEFKSIRISQ